MNACSTQGSDVVRAGINDFRFHVLRHIFASWYLMNDNDLYELVRTLARSKIKMTEHNNKLVRQHIGRPAAGGDKCESYLNVRRQK
jgi:integrase